MKDKVCFRCEGCFCPIESEDLDGENETDCPLGTVVKIKGCTAIKPTSKFTTQELIDELVKRNGVDRYIMTRCEQKTLYGAATILVVRQ